MEFAGKPVVVGIDGSKHALRAAMWASDVAVDRGASLRLLCVVDDEARDPRVELDDAHHALQAATTAIEETGLSVGIRSEIGRGDPAAALIEASRSAQLMCLGAKGMHDSAPGRRGGTATLMAESAFCPVAVIRHRHPHQRMLGDRRVVAVLDESPASVGVWHAALGEARRRHAPILALTSWSGLANPRHAADVGHGLRDELDGYLDDSAGGRADFWVTLLPLPPNVTEFLTQNADVDQLVVIGKSDPALIAELVGAQGRALLRKTNCSVMVVREQEDASSLNLSLVGVGSVTEAGAMRLR